MPYRMKRRSRRLSRRRMSEFRQTSPRNWRHYYQDRGATVTTVGQPYPLMIVTGPAEGVRLVKELKIHVAGVGIPDTTAPYGRVACTLFWVKSVLNETIGTDWWATNKADSERVWAPRPLAYQRGPFQPEWTRTFRFPKISLGKGYSFGLYIVGETIGSSNQLYVASSSHWMDAYRGDTSTAADLSAQIRKVLEELSNETEGTEAESGSDPSSPDGW